MAGNKVIRYLFVLMIGAICTYPVYAQSWNPVLEKSVQKRELNIHLERQGNRDVLRMVADQAPKHDWAARIGDVSTEITIGDIVIRWGETSAGRWLNGAFDSVVSPAKISSVTAKDVLRQAGIFTLPNGATATHEQVLSEISTRKYYRFSKPLGVENFTLQTRGFSLDLKKGRIQIDGEKRLPIGIIETKNPVYLLDASAINVGRIDYAYAIQSSTDTILRATTRIDFEKGMIWYIFDNSSDIIEIDPSITISSESTGYDTHVEEGLPNNNYESQPNNQTRNPGGGDERRLMYQFDLRGAFNSEGYLPSSITITDATFNIINYGEVGGETADVSLHTNDTVWNATVVTWNNCPSLVMDTTYALTSVENTSGTIESFSGSFLTLIQDIVDGDIDWKKGWTIRFASGTSAIYRYTSLDYAGQKPFLELEFTGTPFNRYNAEYKFNTITFTGDKTANTNYRIPYVIDSDLRAEDVTATLTSLGAMSTLETSTAALSSGSMVVIINTGNTIFGDCVIDVTVSEKKSVDGIVFSTTSTNFNNVNILNTDVGAWIASVSSYVEQRSDSVDERIESVSDDVQLLDSSSFGPWIASVSSYVEQRSDSVDERIEDATLDLNADTALISSQIVFATGDINRVGGRAGRQIIPATGVAFLNSNQTQEVGSGTAVLSLAGVSLSDATPNGFIVLLGSGLSIYGSWNSALAASNSISHQVIEFNKQSWSASLPDTWDIEDASVYLHRWYYDASSSDVAKAFWAGYIWDGSNYTAAGSSFNVMPRPSINTSGLHTTIADDLNRNLIISQIIAGHIGQASTIIEESTMFIATAAIARATTGLSSTVSINCPSGAFLGYDRSIIDILGNTTRQGGIFDHPEYASSVRAKVHLLPLNTQFETHADTQGWSYTGVVP